MDLKAANASLETDATLMHIARARNLHHVYTDVLLFGELQFIQSEV